MSVRDGKVRLVAFLGSSLDSGLALYNALALGQDIGPVLEDCEWHVLARAVADQVVTLLGEEQVCFACCREI